MNRYTKIINMMDSYYTKDYEKTKKIILYFCCFCNRFL